MATSGYKDVAATKNHTLRFSWTLKSQSVADNTSTISWDMKLINDGYGNMISSTAKTWKVVINGKTYSGTVNITHDVGETITLASGTATIGHSADGTKTFSYSFTQQIAITYAGSRVETISGSGSGTLTTIPRASTVKATSAYIESNSTITITRASSSFKHTLQYKISGQSSYTTIVSKTSSTSYSWEIPTTVYSLLSSTETKKTITINCITYNGSTKIGEATCTLTATCKESLCKPTLAPTVKDTGSVSIKLTGDGDNTVIKDYNVMTYAINATAKNGATIKSQKITCGSASSTAASGKLSYVSSNEFVITALDSRGFSSSTTIKKSKLIDFVKLTCNMDVAAKLATDASGNSTTTLEIKASGKWFNGSFGAVANTITVQYRYKTGSGSYGSWTSITPTKSGNTYSASKNITGLDYTKTYTVQVRAYDELYNNGDTAGMGYKETSAKTVSSKPIFDWGKEDFNFNVPVKMPNNSYKSNNGGLNMNNSDLYGINGLYFADVCSYNSGEGIMFPNKDGTDNYDVISAFGGKIYFKPCSPEKSSVYELCYTPGGTMKIGDNTPMAGYITNGSKSIFFTIPVNKPLVGVSGVSLSGSFEGRGISGYLYNPTINPKAEDTTKRTAFYNLSKSASSQENFTYSAVLSGDVIRITITFADTIKTSSSPSSTDAAKNNTPVAITPAGTITITFS